MKVFVAGATGVLGIRAVRALVEAGHEVSGVARNPDKAAVLERTGARPVSIDLFDAAAVNAAVAGHDVVANLATHIPRLSRAALPGAWAENDRIRSQASNLLVDAAIAAGAGRYLQESISFIYRDAGAEWIDEDAPIDVAPYASSVLDAEAAAARFAAAGGAGVVLRFAAFYGPDSHHTIDAVKSARRRLALQPGAADSYVSSIATDDAASAVAAALNVGSGTYNVGDDEPVTRRRHADLLAAALGVKPLRVPPPAVGRLGGSKVTMLMRSQRVSNRRFRQASGWAPAYPSVADGLPVVVPAVLAALAAL